jgi:GxxExxY protein
MSLNELTFTIRGAIFTVHRELGPGLLENIYAAALMNELVTAGLRVEHQRGVPVIYKGNDLGLGYRIDLLIEDEVIVEIKSVEALHDVHKKQLLTYLKLSGRKVGLLVNFNDAFIEEKRSLIRIINGYGF